MSGRRRLLVVGNGMAADRLLDELVAREGLAMFDVTVVGEEPSGAYNRVLLSRVLAGGAADLVVTKPVGWYAEAGVRLIAGRWVQRLDTAARLAHIGDGQTLAYDVAVLATGSRAVLPPVAGATAADGGPTGGVHVYRSLEDCVRLGEELDPVGGRRHVVVVGGGLLGLEAAVAARDLGHRVVVVHPFDHLLNAQLDETGGRLVRRRVEAMGIDVAVGRAAAVLAGPSGPGASRPAADALLLDDGRILPADTVVFAVGVTPRIETAVASGIEVDRGIVVDDGLATSSAGVLAIGECAQYGGVTPGLVAPGWDQARVVADRLTGADPAARYRPAPVYARLKVAGLDVTSMGRVDAADGDEVVEIHEPARHVHRRLVVRDGRLAGAVLVGDASAAPLLIGLLERAESLPANRLDLFCSADAFRRRGSGDGTLCNCNRVSREQVVQAIGSGAASLEQVGRVTRAGTGCGSCVDAIAQLLAAEEAAAA